MESSRPGTVIPRALLGEARKKPSASPRDPRPCPADPFGTVFSHLAGWRQDYAN